MSRTFGVDPDRPDDFHEEIAEAAAALEVGGLVVLPTETVYGIACRPDDAAATARLFEAKRRPRFLNLPVLVASTAQAWELGARSHVAGALADRFWPGPLTMVLPRTERSRPWGLGDAGGTIGLRVPDQTLTLRLLERTGPIAATSANLTGEPPVDTPDALEAAFGSTVAVSLILLNGAMPPGGVPSTVLDLASAGIVKLLREGPIDRDEVGDVIAATIGVEVVLSPEPSRERTR